MNDQFKDELKRNNEHVLYHYEQRTILTEEDSSNVMYFEISTGGASGGNCWNDDPAEDYYIELDEIQDEMQSTIYNSFSSFAKEKGYYNLRDAAYNFVSLNYEKNIDTRTDYEYYGNYTTYNLYSLNIDDFINTLQIQPSKTFKA